MLDAFAPREALPFGGMPYKESSFAGLARPLAWSFLHLWAGVWAFGLHRNYSRQSKDKVPVKYRQVSNISTTKRGLQTHTRRQRHARGFSRRAAGERECCCHFCMPLRGALAFHVMPTDSVAKSPSVKTKREHSIRMPLLNLVFRLTL